MPLIETPTLPAHFAIEVHKKHYRQSERLAAIYDSESVGEAIDHLAETMKTGAYARGSVMEVDADGDTQMVFNMTARWGREWERAEKDGLGEAIAAAAEKLGEDLESIEGVCQVFGIDGNKQAAS